MPDYKQMVQDVLDGNESADKACEMILNEISTLKRCFSQIYECSIHELNKVKKDDTIEDWLELERSHIVKFRSDVSHIMNNSNPTRITLEYDIPHRRKKAIYTSEMGMVVLRNFLDSFDFELQKQEREIYTAKR